MGMSVHKPPFTITDDITVLVAEISEEIGRISVLQENYAAPHLRRRNRIRTIHSSLAIEHNSLTMNQVTAIIDGKRVLGNPNEIREVRNAYEAYELMLELDPLSADDLLKAHGLMMAGLVPESGRFRSRGVGIFDGDKLLHIAPPAELIPGQIQNLISWYRESGLHPLIKSAVFHYEFEFIHPFADGNGRIARTITEMLLAKADGLPHRYYSLSLEIMKNRKEYYDILEYTQKNTMDVTKFIEYFLKTIQKSVATSQAKIEKTIAKTKFWDSIRKYPLNERQIKILNMMQEDFEGKLTTAKWEKLNKCSHSTALRDIKDLIDKGILIDDGKHSKNTSYLLQHTEKNG